MPDYGFRTGIFATSVKETAQTLKGIGYDCVELCLEREDVRPETLDRVRCLEIRAELDRIGIGPASVSYHADREPLDQRRANQERAVHIAHWMEAEILVLSPERATDVERQWPEHAARFQRLCALADELGVTIAIEPEPLLVVGSSEDAARMIEEVGSPRLAVNLDVGHAYLTDDDLVASIHALGSQIVHLHLEDIAGRVHRHLPFGEGEIDFVAVRQALEQTGYDGPYVVDLFGQDAPSDEVASRALADLRRLFG
jgi:sugar phosphate isomerase/epimerase